MCWGTHCSWILMCTAIGCIPERYRQNRESNPTSHNYLPSSHSAIRRGVLPWLHKPLHDVSPDCSHTLVGVGPKFKVLRALRMIWDVANNQHKRTTPACSVEGERGRGKEERIGKEAAKRNFMAQIWVEYKAMHTTSKIYVPHNLRIALRILRILRLRSNLKIVF